MTAHHNRPTRWAQLVAYGLLILFAAVGLRLGSTPPPTAEAAPVLDEAADAFGPMLFVVSAAPEREADLLEQGRIHARLTGSQARFIASGSQDEATRLADMGFAVQQLDDTTAGKVYYFVQFAKSEDLAQVGRILWEENGEVLLSVDRGQELRFVEAAPVRAAQIALLSPARLHPAPLYSPLDVPAELEAAAQAPANTFVTGLLDQVTNGQIATLINELSGVQPVNVYGTTVNLNPRYTFSTRIRDSERYLYQFYEQRGIPVQYWPWTYGSYSGRNVIAQITGTTHPERIWIVGGHFDSNSQDPYNSAPGADDNASGTASTLVIADILRQIQLSETVRFVHFSGEEQGQWGSKPYAQSLALAGEQIMGYIDLDMIGWDGNGDRVMEIHTGTRQDSNNLGTLWMAANAAYGQQLVVERKSTTASRFSDHSPFWDNGFPAFLAIENFFVDAIPADRNPWYHNTGDIASRVDVSYVVRHAKVALAVLAEQAGAFTGPTPTATHTATATPTFTPTATPQPGCVQLIADGGFEGNTGWSFGPTPLQAGRVTSPVLAGSHALRMGATDPASTAYSHSSAYQTVTIPAGATSATLSFSQRPGPSGESADYREILLLNENLSFRRTLERTSTPGTDQWQSRQFDLMAERGATVVLYFNVFNNGSAPARVNYLDEVSLIACVGTTPTPTPSQTPTSAPTSTPTITPTATSTPSPTPTGTRPNTATPTPTPSPLATSTATFTATPTVAAYPPPQTSTPTHTPTNAPTVTPTSYPGPSERVFVPLLMRLFRRDGTPAPTSTPTRADFATPTRTLTPTQTLTPTPILTPTATPSSTPSSTPSAIPTATGTPTPTATPGSLCQELAVNGGFESSGGWGFGTTPAQAFYVSDPALVFAGQRSLSAGIPPGGANRVSHSSAFQTIALPSGMGSITLTVHERPVAGDSSDYREILLLRPDFSYLTRLDRSSTAGDSQWRARTFDLTNRGGASIVLYFNTYNNGSGSTATTYLDEVSISACP